MGMLGARWLRAAQLGKKSRIQLQDYMFDYNNITFCLLVTLCIIQQHFLILDKVLKSK